MGAVLPEAKGGVFEVPCRALPDPDVFFETAPESVELARAVCAPCPLRTACFEGARQRGEPCGVWGGEQFDNGRVIRKAGRRRRRRLAA